MPGDTREIRRLQTGGHLAWLTYSKDGSHIFVGGWDATIHMLKQHNGLDEGEALTFSSMDGSVTCMDVCADFMISGCEDTIVRRFKKHTVQLSGHVTQFGGIAVNCVAIDPKGKLVAAGSEEPVVRLVGMEDSESVRLLEGHDGGVRKMTWHPTSPWLTVCGCNGVITVWDVSTDEPRVRHRIDGIIPRSKKPAEDEDDREKILHDFWHDCSAIWHPSGEHFFVLSQSHEIVTISRTKWAKTATFSDDAVVGTPTALAMSPNGVYLATAVTSVHPEATTSDPKSKNIIYIWSTDTHRVISTITTGSHRVIVQIVFSPTENILAFTDAEGWYCKVLDVIPATMASPVKAAISTKGPATTPITRMSDDLFASIEPEQVTFEDDDFGDLADAWENRDNETPPPLDVSEIRGYNRQSLSLVEAQPPFQPGSTPKHLSKRYLAFSTLGVIEVTESDDDHNVINIEFFDKSTRRGTHFNDYLKYDKGYLGERGAVFSCPATSQHCAKVAYKPYGSWSSQSDWTYDLASSSAQVLGIAVGSMPPASSLRDSSNADLQGCGNVIVATDEGDLTFLSGTGRERRIMGLGADYISMVASAEWVFVVHRVGSTTADESQNLSYSMINLDDFSIRQRDVLPLPKKHTLKWIGIIEEGAPAIYDSSGRVHVLTKHRIPHHASWARLMDTNLLERRQGKDESYWPVGITGSTFMCIILKGRQEYPEFPRPLIQELPINIPFRNLEPMEEQLERDMLLRDFALDALEDDLTTDDIISKERAMDKELIKLILAACKNDNIPRAIELGKLLHSTKSLDAAVKVAEFNHFEGLKERFLQLKGIREESEDRLVLAREKRKQWNRRDAPARRLPDADDGFSRTKAFQDFGPPPSISRPGLTRAQPNAEPPKYLPRALAPKPWDEDVSDVNDVTTPEGKRKRTPELEDSAAEAMPPPKQKTNPFARKQPVQTEVSRNPFARRNNSNKVIQKSESFFEKIDAVETIPKTKRTTKGKEKKELGPRQTTLFGMLPKNGTDAKKSSSKVSKDDEHSQSQSTDVPMSDVVQGSDITLVDSQELSPWEGEETQLNDEEV